MRHAAVHAQVDAGDEGAFVGGEEDDRGGDLLRLANAAERNLAHDVRAELFHLFRREAHLAEDRGFDGAGAEGVDADFAGFEVRGPAAGEGADGGFAGAVDAEAFVAGGCGDGCVEDDGGAILEEGKGFGIGPFS